MKQNNGNQFTDVIRMRGSIELCLRDLQGNVLEYRKEENTVVTTGRRWVMQQIQSVNHATAQNLSHIAIGTSTAAPATSDIALGSEVTRAAISSFSTANLTSAAPSWQAQISFATNEGNTTLGEVAIFNSSAAGTMFNRATFTTISKATSNTLAISYTVSN